MSKLSLVAFFLVLSVPIWAQTSTATLTGIITDPSQAKLPGVRVQLVNNGTGVTSIANSNTQGEFTFTLLPAGAYKLSVEAKGFRGYAQTGIVLESGRTFRLDIPMELGQVNESLTVTSTVPLLESESATVGQFIENKTVADMPLNGRRVGDLLTMVGNSAFIQGDVIRPRVVIAGGRGDQQQWLIDGGNSSNMALEVTQALFNPPVEAVQEIRVQQNGYSAEYGNSSSGVIAITTRSGTNKLRGALYEFFRNDKLDARNFFAAQKAPLRWNIFGGAVGGPVIKNRTFFFSSIEWQKQRVGVTRVLTVPTAAQRAGDFSQTFTAAGALVRIYDPNTTRPNPANPSQLIRDQFPGNIIPQNRIDPVAAKIAPLYPLPNQAASNVAGANNFNRNGVTALNITTWTSKVDHIFREKDRISGRFILHDFPTSNSPSFDVAGADPNANTQDRRAYSFLVDEIHNFTPTLISDFRFEWQPRRNHNASAGLGQGWPEKLGLKGVANRAFPRITAAGFTAMGLGTQERIQMPIHDTDIVESLSWFHGAHSIKFGGEVRLARNVDIFDQTVSGLLAFNTQPTALPGTANTGNAIASMLVGMPNSGQILSTDLLDRRAKYFALFIQEDWKVSSKVTVNLGLRWDTHTPRTDVRDRQNSFDLHAINPLSRTPGVVTFAGIDGLGSKLYNGDYNNFAPRLGVAWKVDSKTVVRSGYGIFFGPPLPGSNSSAAGFQTSGNFSTPDNGITPPFLLRDGFPSTSREPLTPAFGAVAVGQPVRFAPTFVEQDRKLGYSQQWNLGIQRELGWGALVELAYLGNVGHRLNGPDTSINQVPTSLLGPGNAQVRRPFPQFDTVTLIAPMWGNSSYHGLNVKVEKRFSHGLNFLANYSFSKFIDDVPAAFEVGDVSTGIQNFYDRRAEKSLSGNDIRNRFVLSTVWEVPVGRGRHWLSSGVPSMIVGGWNLGLVMVLQQGSPYDLTTQTSTTNAFAPGSQRVNVLRNPTLSASERTVDHWFDTSAVAAPALYTFGNSSRALLTSPGVRNANISLLKNHRFHERYNVQVRLEAFNFVNHANFQDPGRALGAAGFGVISVAGDPRILQLGMRFEF